VIAQRARFRHARKIERAVGYRIPDLAFHGATLDALSSRLNPDRLDHVLKDQVLAFFNAFLRCGCRDSPQCGCPEKKYGIDLYPADVLSFLEESVHVLEAIRDIAGIQNLPELEQKAIAKIALIER